MGNLNYLELFNRLMEQFPDTVTAALRKEAEQIERELKEDPVIDHMKPPKELYDRIVQELKDKGIYHEDDPGV
ncbi:hypothetical protein C3B58_21580 [Lactonifactor longoviformis]|uniref:Uncharacterized protein n=1 Tax=Lactonifactor longoviformis DSM 17459 TaxID=1122155 RepID=A0A1M5CQN3_9CLOT|nr:hypothetical protein [Lactonifactor longoviformis]POP30386.1 hypothetical protein C3B58_21580 [Lactonifactor longoviformis]SHF57018.1 hypothetical protein SAMN02745158_04248 [Lactonifactor longoviformis DSM 17459]